MKLPTFDEFIDSVNMNELSYDLSRFATDELKKTNSLFTKEQNDFLSATIVTMLYAFLQQYHQWLSEQLSELSE